MADLLSLGRKTLEQEHMDLCPLCGQKIDRASTLADIELRLKTLQQLSDKAADIRKDFFFRLG